MLRHTQLILRPPTLRHFCASAHPPPPPGTATKQAGGTQPTDTADAQPEHLTEADDAATGWGNPWAASGAASPFDTRAIHAARNEQQVPPVLPGTGSASIFPGMHANDPVRPGVESLKAAAAKAGHALQQGADHAGQSIHRGLERGEEAVDHGAEVVSGTAHDVKEGTVQGAIKAGRAAREEADYMSKEAQELYRLAAKRNAEEAAKTSTQGHMDAAEAMLNDPHFQRDEQDRISARRKGAARRPGVGVDPKL